MSDKSSIIKVKNPIDKDFLGISFHAQENNISFEKNLVVQSARNNTNQNTDYLNYIIQKQHFALFEQRQWDINLEKPMGTEVLLRIPSATDDQIYLSSSFWIDFAESNDKLEELSYKIITKLIKNLHLLDICHAPYYVNIPPPIISTTLVEHIKTQLDQLHLPYHLIGIELTERQPIVDFMNFRQGIDALHQLKIPVALDDYGRGYATMHFLRDLRVNRIKIDRGLLHDAKKNLSKRLILVSLLDFATEYNIQVIAEGVETEADHFFARQLNCDGVQGFYSGEPTMLVDVNNINSKSS